jgi:electron transfer flavoprotein alpha subunit
VIIDRKTNPSSMSPAGSAVPSSTWPGCKSAKHLLAVNTDPDAPIMRSADYAVIGDLHEVMPAVVEPLRALPG